MTYCAMCGQPIDNTENFCGSCGNDLHTQRAAATRAGQKTGANEPGHRQVLIGVLVIAATGVVGLFYLLRQPNRIGAGSKEQNSFVAQTNATSARQAPPKASATANPLCPVTGDFFPGQSGSDLGVPGSIVDIDGKTIQVHNELDAKVYSYCIDMETVYCNASTKAADWINWNEKVQKKSRITLKLSKDSRNTLVVWDQPPTMSFSPVNSVVTDSGGLLTFTYPPMCR